MNTRAHVIITGRVQGVFYRASTCNKAIQLGLYGWVRNCPDGNVEALFEGPEETVKEMIDWCYEGPPHSSVKSVDVKQEKYLGEFQDFSIRYYR